MRALGQLSVAIGVALSFGGCAEQRAADPAPTPVAPTASSVASATAVAPAPLPEMKNCAPRRAPRGLPVEPRVGSTIALARYPEKTVAYVADEDAAQVRVIDPEDGRELSAAKLGGKPGALLVGRDGRVFVTLPRENRIAVLEPAASLREPLEVRCRVETAPEPVSLASDSRGETLYVASRWGRTLTAYATQRNMEARSTTRLARDPQAVAVSKDDHTVYVTHQVGGVLSALDVRPPQPALRTKKLGKKNGAVKRLAGQLFALVPTEEGDLLAPHTLVHPGDRDVDVVVPGTGYGQSSSFSIPIMEGGIARLRKGRRKVRPGGAMRHCLLPRAAVHDDRSGALLVACQGIDRVLVLDGGRRFIDVGSGPTGLALDAARGQVVVWSQFDRAVTVATLPKLQKKGHGRAIPAQRHLLEERGALPPAIALGRRLFHSAGGTRIASDGRSCASCHPNGKDDGHTWMTPEGPRQTPTLMGRIANTAPFGWNGKKRDIHAHLRRTIRRLGGRGITRREQDALLAYIGSMTPPPTPKPSGTVLAQVERGEELFTSEVTGCSNCHVDGHGTDRLNHDVASLARADQHKEFDTPSLRFVSQTAPYFHDGRFASLEDMLADTHIRMGRFTQLRAADKQALIAYMRTL